MPEPVVLLHSGGMSSRQWRRLAAELGEDRAVHAPDFVGHGSRVGEAPGTGDPLAVDVAGIVALLRGLDAPADVVGHSYGGLVALLAARAAPGTVRRLVLFEPVAFGVLHGPPADDEAIADLARLVAAPGWDAPGPPGEAWFRAFVDFWSGPGAWDALGEAGRSGFRAGGRTLVDGAVALTAERTSASGHAELDVPVLLLGGDASPLAIRRVVDRLEAALPDVRRETVASAGHMGPLTHADDFNGRARAFLAD